MDHVCPEQRPLNSFQCSLSTFEWETRKTVQGFQCHVFPMDWRRGRSYNQIMWSNINPNFPERGSWTANHVVPLADREIPQEAESSTNVDLADSFELDSFMSTSSSERPLDITLSPITSSSPVPEVHTKTAKYHPHGTLNNGTFMETEMLNILFGKSKNTNIKRFRTHQR